MQTKHERQERVTRSSRKNIPETSSILDLVRGIRNGNILIVRKLITSLGKDVNGTLRVKTYAKGISANAAGSTTYTQTTPLVLAVQHGQLDVLGLLLLHGADANIRSLKEDGQYPVHIAASRGAQAILIRLLEHGADKNVLDKAGNRAIETAKQLRHDEIVRVLSSWASPWDIIRARQLLPPMVANPATEPLLLRLSLLGQKESTYGPKHPGLIRTLEDIAQIYREQGNLSEESMVRIRIYQLVVLNYGKQCSAHVEAANNLAESFFHAKEYTRAAEALREAVRIADLEQNGRAKQESIDNLGFALFQACEYTDAEPVFSRALALTEASLNDPSHPKLARLLLYHANVLGQLDRFKEAKGQHARAIAILDMHLGPFHPNIATAIDCLGNLFFQNSDFVRAEALFRRALAIREEIERRNPETDSRMAIENAPDLQGEIFRSKNNLAMAISARATKRRKPRSIGK